MAKRKSTAPTGAYPSPQADLSKVCGFYESGDHAAGEDVKTHDVVWGLYGIASALEPTIEGAGQLDGVNPTEVVIELASAARVLSRILVNRMALGEYVEKCSRRPRGMSRG